MILIWINFNLLWQALVAATIKKCPHMLRSDHRELRNSRWKLMWWVVEVGMRSNTTRLSWADINQSLLFLIMIEWLLLTLSWVLPCKNVGWGIIIIQGPDPVTAINWDANYFFICIFIVLIMVRLGTWDGESWGILIFCSPHQSDKYSGSCKMV